MDKLTMSQCPTQQYCHGYNAAVDKANKEIEALRADAERWQAMSALMFICNLELKQDEDGGYSISVDPVENIIGKTFTGDTPEEAIDKARGK